MKKALIAMSGGVDSSAAAARMKELGYECIGATMMLYENGTIGISRQKTCCSLDDVEDARNVAMRLGMPYYVMNFKADFKEKVMDRFVQSYLDGCTPNPCIDCNRYLKFEHLFHRAQELECDVIVTGHYARVEYDEERGRYTLRKAADLSKDQSYVLYSLTQEQLAHTCLPLGEYKKEEVREYAERYGLINARKRDSQDICFVPDGDYAGFIEQYCGKKCGEGNFVDKEGNVIGPHKGICHYTIGQRKGLGIAASAPLYVNEIRPDTNEVVLGSNEDLFSCDLTADEFNWLSMECPKPGQEIRCSARIRYRHKEQPATAVCGEDGSVSVHFDEPQRAITKGQAVVLYDGEYVLGGGTIVSVEK